MFLLGSRSRFIISFRFSGLLMYLLIVVKLFLSKSSSPRSYRERSVLTEKHVVFA